MRKRLLSLVLSLIMVVNMTAVGLSAFAEEALETTISESLENEILIDGIINTVYLTSVGQYSVLDSEEQAVLQEYYQLTDDQFTACETLGYTILESVRIAKAAAAVDLSPEEYDRFVSVYGSENIANSELLRFHNTKHLYSPQEVQQILGAMLQGQAMQQAVLSIPPFEETTVEITPIRPTDEITSSNTGSTERTQPATIEREFINSPVQYYAKNNEQVNASTGTFSYRQNLFTFDGIGELDVSLTLYSREMQTLTTVNTSILTANRGGLTGT